MTYTFFDVIRFAAALVLFFITTGIAVWLVEKLLDLAFGIYYILSERSHKKCR